MRRFLFLFAAVLTQILHFVRHPMNVTKLPLVVAVALLIILLPAARPVGADDRIPEVSRWTSVGPDGAVNVLVGIPKDRPDHDKLLLEELVSTGWPGGELDLASSTNGPQQLDGSTYGFTWCSPGQAGHVGFSTQTGPGYVVWTHNSIVPPPGPIVQPPNYGYCDGFGGCSYIAHGNVTHNPFLAPWWIEINWQGADPYVFTEYCTW